MRRWGKADVVEPQRTQREEEARSALAKLPATPWLVLDEVATEAELKLGIPRRYGTDPDGRVWSAWESPLWTLPGGSRPMTPPAEVRCSCGSVTFRITYGEYSCSATCTDCGATGEIYSG